MGECQAHLKAVKSQVAANQEKLGKLSLTEPRIATTESRVEALEKQASQTTDPRRRPTSAAAAFPTPQPPPGPSHVDQQKTVDMQKAVDEVKGRVGQLEARVGVVDELEKKVADVQLKVDEVAQDVMKKRDADDMEIDDDSGSGEKLSVLEKRLEEVRDEWVKEVRCSSPLLIVSDVYSPSYVSRRSLRSRTMWRRCRAGRCAFPRSRLSFAVLTILPRSRPFRPNTFLSSRPSPTSLPPASPTSRAKSWRTGSRPVCEAGTPGSARTRSASRSCAAS